MFEGKSILCSMCHFAAKGVDIDKPKHAALGSFVGPLVNSMQSVGQTSVVWFIMQKKTNF